MQLTAQECEEKIQDLNNQIQRLIGYKQALLEMEEETGKEEIKIREVKND
tara:strand:+ start:819 stop:968 length:150 start_codon:yes stop_codon:yes gene_type:complete